MNDVVSSIIGSGVSSGGNIIANELAYKRQLDLNRQRYADYFDAMRKAGGTPTSLVQGLSGSGPGSMPVTSTSNNPVSDLGQTLNQSVSAGADKTQASAAEKQADTDRMLALMRLRFEPAKYIADIRKSLAEAFESSKHAFLFGSMKTYYDEQVKDLQYVRPWKIAGLRQGLINDMATYNKIVQDTRTSKAQERFYNASSYEARTRGDLNVAQKDFTYTQTLNESLKGFRIQFDNTLLSYGIDTSKSFWENTSRLMYTNPKLFNERVDMFVNALNILDGRLQKNLGDNYKRDIVAGVGLYKLNQIYQKNANGRAYRGAKAAETISRFIPFLNLGSGIPDNIGPNVDWWLKD